MNSAAFSTIGLTRSDGGGSAQLSTNSLWYATRIVLDTDTNTGEFFLSDTIQGSHFVPTGATTYSSLGTFAFGFDYSAAEGVSARREGGGVNMDTLNIEYVPVPEPSTTALLGLGGLTLILRRKK